MKKFKVYVTRRIPEAGLEMLREFCNIEINPHDRPVTRDELLENAAGKDGVLGLLTDKIDGDFFDAADRLKGYANYAVGYDNIDVAEATARRIPVSNTPGVLTDATAEMAWALLFAACRKVVESDREMRSGRWKGWGPLQFVGAGVKGRTLGIVGPGRIGSAMALMSRGFSMKVLYAGRSPKPVLEKELGAEKVGLDRLLAESDFISIHTPLTPETRHMFGADQFRAMKSSAYIINTARGAVINEAELVEALKSGEIAGAGLDVYENEPDMAPGLAQLDNVVIAAHTGSATEQSRSDMSLLAAKNLLAMMKGDQPPTCLNPEVFKS